MSGKAYLTVKEVAAIYSLSIQTIYRWIKEGKLEADRIGGTSLRIRSIDADRLIPKQETYRDIEPDEMPSIKITLQDNSKKGIDIRGQWNLDELIEVVTDTAGLIEKYREDIEGSK